MKTKLYFFIILPMALTVTLNAQSGNILEELGPKSKTEKETNAQAQKTVAGQKSSEVAFDMKANTDSLNLLQKKTEELGLMSLKIRNDCKGKPEPVKKLLLSEAGNLDQQSQITQIAASNLSSRINNYKFNKNKSAIKGYVTKTGEENVPVYTKNLIFDSEKIMRLAKEMREEANAQPTVASKLGTMGNADEQEEIALGKQVEALTQLERASQTIISANK